MTRSTARAVCVGTLLLDTIASVDRLPGEDERVEADQVVLAGGGNASTAAVAMARLGVEVDFAGVVGADEVGRTVLEQLESEGVGTSHVVVRDDVETTHSVVIVSRASAARTIITRPATVPSTIPTGYDWVHVDKIGYAALAAAGGSTSRVSIDDGNPIPDLDLRLIDLYVPTALVLSSRYPGQDPLGAARSAMRDGASTVVATAGSRGSFGVTGESVAFAPSLEVEPVSSLGAGDVFHGALLAALILGKDLGDAMRFANVTAALSMRALDGRSGIPGRPEVEAVLAELSASPFDLEQRIRTLLS
jgi:sulfofructose kinase